MPALFALVLFVSAGLLFLLQPMAAKMILPKFGGTPAVWNTSMLFFQAGLLAGYAYAHASTARLGARRQAGLHVLLLVLGLAAVPLVTLPIAWARDWAPPPTMHPVLPLLGLLLASVGVPFFIVSTTAPLLQRWFATTGHPAGKDPYFLYAASNAGSFLALLAYPLWVEPLLPLRAQGRFWMIGYGLLAVLVAACAVVVRRTAPQGYRATPKARAAGNGWAQSARKEAMAPGRRARWVALAFVPTSLMLGVTTYITTDVAPVPLLWVLPLGLYLLSFVFAFARLPERVHRLTTVLLPGFLLLLLLLILPEEPRPVWLFIGLHLIALFVIALYCHGELARDRPPVEGLTGYFMWVSVGGVLGGLFNAVVAPLAFSVIVEYPLFATLACLLDAPVGRDRARPVTRGMAAILLGVAAGLLLLGAYVYGGAWGALSLGRLSVGMLGLLMAAAAVSCWLAVSRRCARPTRLGLGVGVVMAGWLVYGGIYSPVLGRVVFRGRSFFGVHRIYEDPRKRFFHLLHGGIIHGFQPLAHDGRPAAHPPATGYYHPSGPIGQVFEEFNREPSQMPVAVVGLGAGGLAAYGQPRQEFVFYEIDPAIERLARDPRYFTYLRDCPTKCRVILGDARLSLIKAPEHHYGLLVVDAFSSDAIPVHLLTREALQLYLRKLAPDGLLAFHVTNRYLNLEPIMRALAADAGLCCWIRADLMHNGQRVDARTYREYLVEGRQPSTWMLLARRSRNMGRLAGDRRWKLLPGPGRGPVWTDDFSNLLGALR